MTIDKLFQKHLKQVVKEGFDHKAINCLAGCTDRKLTLTEAEGEAGKRTFQQFMAEKLWNDPEIDTAPGWLFGSPKTNLNIGLVPGKLAYQRKGLNRSNWHLYQQIT